MLHKDSSLGWRHAIHNWEVADAAARAALSVTSDDIGKVALQLDTLVWYILTDDSPVTWAVFTGESASPNAHYLLESADAGLPNSRVLAVAGAALSIALSSGLLTLTLATDTDGTLAANSDAKIATQKAVKTYVDALLAGANAVVYKGAVDCSTNPDYPAADAGHVYRVSVAGKIGGASGPNVEAGDTLLCDLDGSASGNHATVGANWVILQANLDGAVIGPASSTNNHVAFFSGTTGKLIADSGLTLSGTNTGDQTIVLTGDVTGTGVGSFAATIANDAVTNAKLANMATKTYKGRTSGSTGDPEDVAVATVRADLGEKVSVLTDAATIAVDASLANNFRVTLGGNRTLGNPTNLIDGQVFNIRIIQDGTGSRTLAYSSKYKFAGGTAPVLSTAPGSKDFISCQYDATDDTIFAVLNKAFA